MESDPLSLEGRLRVLVEAVRPQLDAGAYPIKRILGDMVVVRADLVSDGHDPVTGLLHVRHESQAKWTELPLAALGNDEYEATFVVDQLGTWFYTVEAWIDAPAAWLHALEVKRDAGAASAADLPIELAVGAELLRSASARASGADGKRLATLARSLADKKAAMRDRVELALSDETAELLARYPNRELATRYDRQLAVTVERPKAQFSSWYEMFPRSTGAPGQHGTFATAQERLPYIAEMGFDILYLPPIHPIGKAHRKGPNNTLEAGASDVGSPWAIGAAEGGHTAIHPQLGTASDFRKFVAAAKEHGLEVALDIALQASPDHPWVKEHPEWFKKRPDGSIQYAENPPKKYQDIYPLDFESSDWRGLWKGLHGVFEHWIDQGVKIFRVDNPHTKSLRFWGWCIGELRRAHPDVLFLSEAFTKPKLMYALAKLGFSQSYTYFTWRESAWDLRTYLEELTSEPVVDFFRPNFWPNTPDILPDHLMHAHRGVFAQRLILAATLCSNYGIYGPAFELMDNVPRPGSGEYIDNEKYELKVWDISRPDSLRPLIRRINRIRHDNPALHQNTTLHFHGSDNPTILCYSKSTADNGNRLLMAVNTDPHHRQTGFIHLDLEALGLSGGPFTVHDLIGGARYTWHGSTNFVELDPHSLPAHVFRIETT